MSISDRLDEIQRRSDDATEGPWWGIMISGRCEVFAGTGSGSDPMLATGLLPGDAEFVVNARTDVPWLIEQVRKRDAALRVVLDQVTEWRDESFSFFGGPVDEATSVRYECAQQVLAAVEAALGEEANSDE